MNDYLINVVGSIFAGLVTLLTALLFQRSFRLNRREVTHQRERLEYIVQAVQTEEAARKSAAAERIVERIPIGLTAQQFSALLEKIANRIPSPPEVPTAVASAVESLVNNYHEQALSQSKTQFWFSVAAASVGFVWILITGL